MEVYQSFLKIKQRPLKPLNLDCEGVCFFLQMISWLFVEACVVMRRTNHIKGDKWLSKNMQVLVAMKTAKFVLFFVFLIE